MKQKLLFAFSLIFLIFFINFALAQDTNNTEKENCIAAGGSWETLPNPCDHLCHTGKIYCIQVLTEGCYCGQSKCWNGESCQLDNSTNTTTIPIEGNISVNVSSNTSLSTNTTRIESNITQVTLPPHAIIIYKPKSVKPSINATTGKEPKPAEKTESQCPENCTCAGATIKCDLNGNRQMTVVAGKSGNIIVQVKGVNASTNVTIYKAGEKIYGVFEGNQIKRILTPEQIKEKLKIKLEQENIILDKKGFYEVQAKKKARLFLILPVREHIMSHVDAETGEIIKIRNPWWGFLAKDIKEESEEINCGNYLNSSWANDCCQKIGHDTWDLNLKECIFSE